MPALTATLLLDVWEAGRGLDSLGRASLLLNQAYPAESKLALSLGRRNAMLLRLRDQLIGRPMEGLARCPSCAEQVEFSISARDLGAYDDRELPLSFTVEEPSYALTVRLPTVADVQDAGGDGARLYRLLVSAATRDGETIAADAVPGTLRQQAAERLQALDPLMQIHLSLECPACAHQWLALLDHVSFLWQELEQWAFRTLVAVHRLASAYGWHEQEILAMSAWRRQHYLEMAGT